MRKVEIPFVHGVHVFEEDESLVGFGNQLFAENCILM
jgi:hypothetical protein